MSYARAFRKQLTSRVNVLLEFVCGARVVASDIYPKFPEVVSRFWRQFVALHLRLRFFFHFFLNAAISALTSAYVRFQRTRFNGLGNRSIIAFGWRSPFLTPLGVFAICAATIIVASA